MSNDDIYVTERYFGGKIILKGYRDPITHKPTKEFNALHNAFTLIANSEAGAELAERIATSPEGTGPRTIWATPQTAADAGVLPGGKAPAGSRAIPDKDSFKDIRTGTHLLQRFDGTLNVVADLDPVNNSASMPSKLRYNIYYGVDGAYHREAPDMILFHELVHAILGTIDPAEDADSIPGATVRATNKYALEKGYVPQAVYGRPPVDPKGEIFAPDQWISGGTKDSYLKSPDARANVFPDTSGTILHKKDFRHRQLQDQQYPYANASSVDLLRMLIRH